MTFLFGRYRSAANRKVIGRLNDDIVAAVRQPVFYGPDTVPDTFAGRFELLVLHTALMVRRLRGCENPGAAVAQDVIDLVFRHLDFTLREHGVGDLTVPKRMKRLAEAFLGRSVAYDAALRTGDRAALAAALARNIYDGRRSADDLALYVVAASEALEERTLAMLLERPFAFPSAASFLTPVASDV